jgi:hypothetical protein
MSNTRGNAMMNFIWAVVVLLIALWAIGFFFGHLTGIVHVLLVVALIAAAYNLIKGRRAA